MKQTLEGKKELKDYLPFYIGCEVWDSYNERKGVLFGVDLNTSGFDNVKVLHKVVWNLSYECVKPILRPLSDITVEDMEELYLLVFKRKFVGDNITHRDIGGKEERWVLWSGCERLFVYRDGDVKADSDMQHYPVHAPTIMLWQLSRHFDLFNLISDGLAIDIKTFKSNQ